MFFKLICYIVFPVLVVIAFISCSPALYKPVPEQTSGEVSYEQLVKGRQLYVNSCGSCHSLHLPNQYKEEVWVHNLNEMQDRAKISNEDKALILAYLMHAPVKVKK